jgi:hypothetical protein
VAMKDRKRAEEEEAGEGRRGEDREDGMGWDRREWQCVQTGKSVQYSQSQSQSQFSSVAQSFCVSLTVSFAPINLLPSPSSLRDDQESIIP